MCDWGGELKDLWAAGLRALSERQYIYRTHCVNVACVCACVCLLSCCVCYFATGANSISGLVLWEMSGD